MRASTIVTIDRERSLEALLATALGEVMSGGKLTRATALALAAEDVALLAEGPTGGRPYGRRVLHRGARGEGGGEIMLASWGSGRRSAPHDHGGARGVVLVLAGTFEERVFELDGRALGQVRETRRWTPGDSVAVPRDVVHDMASLASQGVRATTQQSAAALSLHFYDPGPASELGAARLYDAEARSTVHTRGGAWLPADEVVAIEAWDR